MIHGLPERLHELRTNYHLSQRQVSEKIGVSPSIISGYETGERTPSTEILLALSNLYNCSTDYLLGKQQNAPDTVLDADGLTANQLQAIQVLISEFRNGNKASRILFKEKYCGREAE